MAGARDVKRRIKSVENTRQITRTRELVATSKLKKATDRVRAARPYADSLAQIVRSLYAPELSERFPLLRSPERVQRAAVLLLTANRGLAGGFNANLIKEARLLLERLDSEGVETDLHIVGKKGIAYFRFRGELRVQIGTVDDARGDGAAADSTCRRVDLPGQLPSQPEGRDSPPAASPSVPPQCDLPGVGGKRRGGAGCPANRHEERDRQCG